MSSVHSPGSNPNGPRRPAENSLIHKLGFGIQSAQQEAQEAAKPHYAEQLGIEVEDADLIKPARAAGVDLKTAINEVIAFKQRQAFPDRASEDPARRAEVAALDASSSPTYQTQICSSSVVVGQDLAADEAKAYLRAQYTNTQGNMYCQAGQACLPFKVNGGWYFEAAQLVRNRGRTHRQNALALCPLCAATYKYKRETTDDALLESLLGVSIEPGQGTAELSVLLNGQLVRLRFTGAHAVDLKQAMAVAGEERWQV